MVAFSAGIVATLWLPGLPPVDGVVAALALGLWLACWPSARPLAAGLAGFVWACSYGAAELQQALPEQLAGRDLVVRGQVADIPAWGTSRGKPVARFLLRVEPTPGDGGALPAGRLLRLNWYGPPVLKAGERWQLVVRLRAPRGMVNPGGFDYRGWLLGQGVDATGYVRTAPHNRRLDAAPGWSLDARREAIAARLAAAVPDPQIAALATALVVGDKSGFSDTVRTTLAATGTSHLLVISGLHIGLCAVVGWWLGALLAHAHPRWLARGWRLPLAVMAAATSALVYAGLAGFGIPTRRALVMVAVMLSARVCWRSYQPADSLLLALVAVLALDPLAGTSMAFWLSFGAVAALVLAANVGGTGEPRWRAAIRAQLAVFLGLAPILAAGGMPGSWVAPWVNLVAIPWVGLLVVPLLLAGTMMWTVSAPLGDWLVIIAGTLLEVFWRGLSVGAEFAGGQRSLLGEPWAVAAALFGAVLVIAAARRWQRMAGLLLCVPLWWWPSPAQDELLRLVVLDVGQGTSVLVTTRAHSLLYDAGPRHDGGFDTGEAIVLPYLRYRRLARLDTLVISHADSDHSGGAGAVAAAMSPMRVIAPDAAGLEVPVDTVCRQGERWDWDGVTFEFLHPRVPLPVAQNNQSCVLQLTAGEHRFLLPGDIERQAESMLLPGLSPTAVALIPHHGSKTSSSPGFVGRLAPAWAVATAGYGNRFGHPRPDVVARWQAAGSEVLNTALTGAIEFRVGADGSLHGPLLARAQQRRFWRAPPSRSGE